MRLAAYCWICTALLSMGPVFAQETGSSKWLSGLKQLTSEGVKSGEGYFSADGSEVVYQSVQKGCPHYQIYTRHLAGGPPKLLSSGQGLTTCAYFHPKVDKILFASTHLDSGSFGPPPENSGRYVWQKHPSFDIFTVQRAGGQPTRLTNTPGYDAEGSYGPRGERIVFTSERDGDYEIYTMKSDGTEVHRITHSPGYDGGPFFSHDGKLICYRGFRNPKAPRYAQVYVCNSDGTKERQLTFNTAVNWAPFFHPDNKHLVYCTNIGGHRNFEVVLLRLSDFGIVRLTHDAGADVMPVFSGDGKKLMWTSTRFGGESQLVVADFVMPPAEAFGPPMKDDPKTGDEKSDGGR